MPEIREGDTVTWTKRGHTRSEVVPASLVAWMNTTRRESLIHTLERDGAVIWQKPTA